MNKLKLMPWRLNSLILMLLMAGCSNSAVTPKATLAPGTIQVSPKDGMPLVYIPAGNFLMGSDQSVDYAANKDELPQHTVYLDAYWIDQTLVTNAMFAKFIQDCGYKTEAEKAGKAIIFSANPDSWTSPGGTDWQHPNGPASSLSGLEKHPVVQVTWNDASAYCTWAGRKLPSEAEWEKAARGSDGCTYPWGYQFPAGNLANFADKNLPSQWTNPKVDDGYEYTSPVGSYPAGASPYGILDMSGNVWEWVADWYSAAYYSSSPSKNPVGPTSGDARVLRGGGWSSVGADLRTARRWSYNPSVAIGIFGFRCASSS